MNKPAKRTSETHDSTPVFAIPIKQIRPPRINMRDDSLNTDMDELKTSIEEKGLLQPIGVTREGRHYNIVWGYRRYRAHALLRRAYINAVIVQGKPLQLELLKWTENHDRVPPNAVETATFYVDLQKKYHLNNKRLAQALKVSEANISYHLDIFDYPENLRTAVADGTIAPSAARELFTIKDDQLRQTYISAAVRNGVTPALARIWKDEANSQSGHTKKVIQPTNRTGEIQTGPIPEFPCDQCGSVQKITTMRVRRFCTACESKLLKKIPSPHP